MFRQPIANSRMTPRLLSKESFNRGRLFINTSRICIDLAIVSEFLPSFSAVTIICCVIAITAPQQFR